MYTTTFYSFKGGVGRTMALVNCAFELAKNGREILIVDFDLEAPGVDSFLHPYGAQKSRGLVDFITDYRATREAPDIKDYMYRAGPSGAKLWVMPAGRRDESYASRLNTIDWGRLYDQEDGYLLFEDLKAQWKNFIDPDYVLIDSRTGHTDVAGICTRQLPDAVALLFRLDQQNLEGLKPIVGAVRREAEGARKANVHLHFFPSNVPDMDDEGGVLEKQLRLFERALHPESMDVMIKHYGDMEMLEHSVFTIERENSRLAKEYRRLAKEIIRQNTEDAEGAKDFLRTQLRRSRHPRSAVAAPEDRIAAIADKHRHDLEVLQLLARIRERDGRYREAIAYLSEAIAGGPSDVATLCRRAELYAVVGDDQMVASDLRAALSMQPDSDFELSRLNSLIQELAPTLIEEIPYSNALESSSPQSKVNVAHQILFESGASEVSIAILSNVVSSAEASEEEKLSARIALTLALMGTGEFGQVIELLSDPKGIQDAFNLAMALWGSTGEVQKEKFWNVKELHDVQARKERDANYDFCIALTSWALEDLESAEQYLDSARDHLLQKSRTFSPWSYRFVDAQTFSDELDEAGKMFAGNNLIPRAFRDTDWCVEMASA